MNILDFIIHNCVGQLSQIYQRVPLSTFKEGNTGDLGKFFIMECGAAVLLHAIWKRWKA